VVTKIPQLKALVVVILQSIPELGNVFALCGLVWFVFGILGVQLFQGVTRGACYDIDSGENTGLSPCALDRPDTDDPIQDSIFCSLDQECLRISTPPNGGVTHFDDILSAFINIFQIMTQQGWTDILYAIQASSSFHVWIYFVLLNFIGPYFVIQLFLVVISKRYADMKEGATEEADTAAAASAGGKVEEPKPRSEPGTRAETLNKVLPAPAGINTGDDSLPLKAEDAKSIRTQDAEALEHSPPDSHTVAVALATPRSGRIQRNLFLELLIKVVRKLRGNFQSLAASTALEYVVVTAIVINTLLMAIDADCEFCDTPTCAMQRAVMELSNIVFTAVFTFESTVKVVGFGFHRYLWIMAPITWLDVGIVVSSLIETPSVLQTGQCYLRQVPCASYDECEVSGGMSVLRIVRLARVLKLLSRFRSFHKQINAIAKTAKSVYYLVVLIFIFVTIFVILGSTMLAGLVVQPWSPETLMRGMRVFVRVPGDDLAATPFPEAGRVATIQDLDIVNHSSRPW
jgi:hypothetical protein